MINQKCDLPAKATGDKDNVGDWMSRSERINSNFTQNRHKNDIKNYNATYNNGAETKCQKRHSAHAYHLFLARTCNATSM